MSQGEGIEDVVDRFIAHKRALGRKYSSAQTELRLLVRFCAERGVVGIGELTPALLDELAPFLSLQTPGLEGGERFLALDAELPRSGPTLGLLTAINQGVNRRILRRSSPRRRCCRLC